MRYDVSEAFSLSLSLVRYDISEGFSLSLVRYDISEGFSLSSEI